MPSLKDMRGKAKEAGLMKLDKLIAKRQSIPSNEFPIPVKELCERYERLYTGCINDVNKRASQRPAPFPVMLRARCKPPEDAQRALLIHPHLFPPVVYIR